MRELTNCPECGKLFVPTPVRLVCDNCYKAELKKLDIVLDFIKKKSNRQASLEEVEEHTGVPAETIERFIKTGKIRVTSLPNFGYPCKKCGAKIREGVLCKNCMESLSNDIKRSDKVSKSEQEVKQRIRDSEAVTYFSKDEPKI